MSEWLAAPKLTSAAIRDAYRKELLHVSKAGDNAEYAPRLVAIYGQADTDRLEDPEIGILHIQPVRSELELRAELPPFDEAGEATAFIVPWVEDLPADISGRFANPRGRVRRINPQQRLLALTGASQLGPGVGDLKLGRYLLRGDNPRDLYPAARGGQLTVNALWDVWLALDWQLVVTGGLSLDTLLAWAAGDGRGAQFQRALSEPSAAGVREELYEHLRSRLGVLGPIAFAAWEAGKGLELLALGILCEAFVASEAVEDTAVNVWLELHFKELSPRALQNRTALVQALAQSTPAALRWLSRDKEHRAAGHELVRRAVARAESLVIDSIRAQIHGSHRLPSAWRMRMETLGTALKEGAQSTTPEAVHNVVSKLRELELHDFVKGAESGDTVVAAQRAEMALRLLAWLAAPKSNLEPTGMQAHADVERLGQWYVTEGGYVDWARRFARGNTEGTFGQGIQAVLQKVDSLRDELDQRFAKALVAWHEAARPATQVVPIDAALERIAIPFLKGGEPSDGRKLLVLLMDGMAWAQAAELLQSLSEQQHPWSPLAWHTHHRIGRSPYPAVLANLPTVTEVSRAAFFAGKPMRPGSKLNTQNDPDHFKNNTKLHPFCTERAAPRLLLRGESHTRDGAASEEAISLIRDTERGIVGIVVNAIDSSLKADPQQVNKWGAANIKSLADILEAARAAGRHVLLASDHGHVPADRLQRISSPSGAGTRYRSYAGAGDPLEPGELKYSGPGVYLEKNAEGVVLLTGDTQRYGSATHAGEHGGASLAEVVAPCVLLGFDDATLSTAPAELQLTRVNQPDWWHYIAPVAPKKSRTTPPAAVTAPSKPTKAKQVSKNQLELGLPNVDLSQQAAVTETFASASAEPDPIAECDMLVARVPKKADRERIAKAVRLLIDNNGVSSIEAFAQHLGVLPFRAEGIVSTFTEALNVDGFEVLRIDRRARQLFLDKSKLETQFALKGLL